MNYLTVNPPPLQGDEGGSTSASGLNFPFGIPFTNQSAFQSAFTPEGFSFESPFGMSSTPFSNTTSLNGNAVAGPSSTPRPKPFPQNTVSGSGLSNHLEGGYNVIPSDLYNNAKTRTTASSATLVTGDRFSQLLEAKLGLDLASQNNALSSLLPTQPFPGTSTSSLEPFDHLAMEQALQDYVQVQVPPDSVAPQLLESFPHHVAGQQFPFAPRTLAPATNVAGAQSASTMLPSSNTYLQPPSYPPATFQTPITSSSSTPRHSPNHRPNSITPFDVSLNTRQPNPDPTSLPPPLRIHVQQTSTRNQPNLSSSVGSAEPADGSWAMELLKGYKKAQSRLSLPGWNGSIPSSQQATHGKKRPQSSLSNHGAEVLGNSAGEFNGTARASPLVRQAPIVTPEPKQNRRKRQASDNKTETEETSDSEYEDTPKRKKASKASTERFGVSDEGKAGSDKKPTIACHICRARKLKCNGAKPKCSNCVRRNEDGCVYDTVLRRRGPGRNNKKDRRSRNRRRKGGGEDAPSKLDTQSPASESSDGTSRGRRRALSLGKVVEDPGIGMGWDQVLVSSMVR